MTEKNANGKNGTPVPVFTETPASVNLKFSYRGADVMLTLRDVNGSTLLDKLDKAMDVLQEKGTTFAGRANSHAANGNGAAPTCPDHGTPMKQSQKYGGWFCPRSVGTHPQTGKTLYCTHKVES